MKKNELVKSTSPSLQKNNQQRLFELLGASKAFAYTGQTAEAQFMVTLMTIQEQELWREAEFDSTRNCNDFDEFLLIYGEFGKTAYYKRKALVEKEGIHSFDIMAHLGISMKQRQQLTAGAITIEGEEVIINDERVPISDKKRIKVLISTLTEKVEAQSRQLEKGQASFEKMKSRALDAEKRAKEASSTVPLRELRQTELIVAITGYADAVRAEPYTDSAALKLAVERIGDALAPLWRALGTTPTSGLPSTGDKDLDSAIDALLDDEDPSETE
jgi:hypothetical protein